VISISDAVQKLMAASRLQPKLIRPRLTGQESKKSAAKKVTQDSDYEEFDETPAAKKQSKKSPAKKVSQDSDYEEFDEKPAVKKQSKKPAANDYEEFDEKPAKQRRRH